MRNLLAQIIVDAAKKDERFVVLSGDHGYALFDPIRKECPEQFINVGVAEQLMVGLSAGLAKTGFRPLVYGLAAFVPIRVLEQIKLDVCFSNMPVIFLGDGAGLVYSTLGASHQCGEDVACLRPLPNIQIFTPADAEELRSAFVEALNSNRPSYIRIGKGDRPVIHPPGSLGSTDPLLIRSANRADRPFAIAMGSMVSPALNMAKEFDLNAVSVPRIKPFPIEFFRSLRFRKNSRCIVFEEHSRYGGLTSALLDHLSAEGLELPKIQSISLREQFSELCGSYQFAMSEHGLSDNQLFDRINSLLNTD